MKTATELEKEIHRTKRHLEKLEKSLQKMRSPKLYTITSIDRERLEKAKLQFTKKYPNDTLHPDILFIAGILPHSTRTDDKAILKQGLAEKYG
jgi:hypothetical protein